MIDDALLRNVQLEESACGATKIALPPARGSMP